MRFFRFMLFGVAACILSMGIAFGITQYLMRGGDVLGGVDIGAHEEALLLRMYANDLLDLADQIEAQTRRNPNRRQLAPWFANVYLPRAEVVRKQLLLVEGLPEQPLAELHQAAHLLRECGLRPMEKELQERAIAQTRRAYEAVEAFVEEAGIRRLPEPRRKA